MQQFSVTSGITIPAAATPTFSPAAGSYSGSQSVAISCSTPSSTIYYTTDGSVPTTGSAVYSSALTVSATETIRAIAAATGYSNSAVYGGTYTIGGATSIFNFTTFTGPPSTINLGSNSSAVFSGSQILLGNSSRSAHQAGSAWYTTPVNIQAFTTTGTFQMPTLAQIAAASGGGAPPANIVGMTFCVQNSNATTNPPAYGDNASADANMAGYGGFDLTGQYPIKNSVAVLFNENPYDVVAYGPGGVPNFTGLYLNGGPLGNLIPWNDINPYGFSFYNGNVISCDIVYDGALLTLVLTDTVTNAQVRQSFPVDIPSVVGANTAFVGWTCGEVPACNLPLNTWAYWTGYNARLATPTFSVAPGSYASTQSVTITGPAGAAVYYTTNGLLPTTQSTLYTGAISVSTTTALQAVAIEAGYTDSLVAQASYAIGSTSDPLINYPSGFTAGDGVVLCGAAVLSGTAIKLTTAIAPPSGFYNGACGAAWYSIPVNILTFTSIFQLQWTAAAGDGMTFCIQNQPPTSSNATSKYVTGGPNALGRGAGGMGYASGTGTGVDYSGLLSSVALAFDLATVPNSVGVYTDGTYPSGAQVATGLTFNSGHAFNCSLSYDGTTLSLSMTDAVTSANFSYSWVVNIPSIVGANTAYAGFTGGTGGSTSNQLVNSWTM